MNPATDLLLWGVDHHRSPTEVREQLHLDADKANALISALTGDDKPGIVSCVPVSTCNRTEIYLEARKGFPVGDTLVGALSAAGLDPTLFLVDYGFQLRGQEAVAHLYRVSAGLESMMLGEPQISTQLKESYHRAKDHGPLGPVIMRAFQGAFRTGKRVRNETCIGTGAVSVAFAAVELARKFFAKFEDHHALLVGAGETGGLAARHFLQQGIGALTLVNRSSSRAGTLAHALSNGHSATPVVRPWSELSAALIDADVVVSTTGAVKPVILPEMVAKALKARRGRPLFLFDIAVPRDVHPDVARQEGLYVFGLDDLDGIVQSNLAARRHEIPRADAIIAEELDEFQDWIRNLDLHPTVGEFRAYLESIKDRQVGWVRKRESDEAAVAVDRHLQHFIKKVLGRSMAALKQAESREERLQHLSSLRRLFSEDPRQEH